MGFDFIVIGPSSCLVAASPLSLDMGYLFMVGSSVLLLMAVEQLVSIVVFSQEETSTCSSTLPS